MSYFYKFVIALLILAAGYSLFGIGHFKWVYHKVENSKTEFLISGDVNSDTTFVEFLNYGCGYCKTLHPVIKELQQVRKDIKYVVRPIAFDGENDPDTTTRFVIAAGFQGKFKEFHEAFLEYPENIIPDDFVQELANLYNVDYKRLVQDSKSRNVEKIVQENLNIVDSITINSVPSFVIKNQIYIITEDNLPDLKTLLNILSKNK